MHGAVQSYPATPAFKNGEQLEDFHGRIIRLQQEIMISGEIVSPTSILFQYTKALSTSDNLIYFIALKITDLIKVSDNN